MLTKSRYGERPPRHIVDFKKSTLHEIKMTCFTCKASRWPKRSSLSRYPPNTCFDHRSKRQDIVILRLQKKKFNVFYRIQSISYHKIRLFIEKLLNNFKKDIYFLFKNTYKNITKQTKLILELILSYQTLTLMNMHFVFSCLDNY